MVYFTTVIAFGLERELAHEMLLKSWWVLSAQERLSVVCQSSETAYAITYPTSGFSATLADLGDGGASPCVASSTQACLIDPILASGTKSGYIFTWLGDGLTPSISYTINGDPAARGSSGRRSFFTLVQIAKSSRGGAPFREVVLAPIQLHLCIQTQ